MRLFARQSQRGPLVGNHYPMHVIGHQAITEQRQLIEGNILVQEGEVHEAVGVAVEDKTAGVTTLGHVVRNVNHDHSCQSRHG